MHDPTWLTLTRRLLQARNVIILVTVLFVLYPTVLRPWMMNWGATPAEQQMALPGDEFGQGKPVHLTRAITINAPPDQIWPWLMQMGQDRAGFYSYDWLENLFSAGMPRVDVIRPEWQHRTVGDKVPLARPDYLGGSLGDVTYVPITVLQPERAISLTGTFVLQPMDAHSTRVLVREYGGVAGPKGPMAWVGAAVGWLVWDPMHFVMHRQMLRGLKAHAEGYPFPPVALSVAANSGWWAAGLALTLLYLARRRWWPGLALPLALAYVTIWKTGDWDAALAGYLSLGLALIGFLAFGRRWWAPFIMLAAVVLLLLLFASDAWITFGLIFLVLVVALVWAGITRLQHRATDVPTQGTVAGQP